MTPIPPDLHNRLKHMHDAAHRAHEMGRAKYAAERRGFWRGLMMGLLLGLVLGVFGTVARMGGGG